MMNMLLSELQNAARSWFFCLYRSTGTRSFPPPCGVGALAVLVLVGMTMVVLVLMGRLWSGSPCGIAGDEFIEEVGLACAVGDEAHADLLNAAHFCAYSFTKKVLDSAS